MRLPIALVLGIFTLQSFASAETATPLQDDAHLHDVQFIGSQTAYAVGERGVIWKSGDGGRTWNLQSSPVDCSLKSVCFLTDKIGWAVGAGTKPYTRIGFGVLLHTRDGGEHWTELASGTLPRLHDVQFFGLNEGIVVGETTTQVSTGVFSTSDAGKTWSALAGKQTQGWRAAGFVDTEEGRIGAVAGMRGQIALVNNERLFSGRLENLGLQGLRDISLAGNGTGWLVGDGGLVRTTSNAGIVWTAPPTRLPQQLSDITNFRAAAHRGQHVWIAGAPGSIIWHSPDQGRTWLKQHTRTPQPIQALHFSSETNGVAVGALGTILRTDDGGEQWQPVRGTGRRLAIMSIHASPERVSLELLAKHSANNGYRSLVSIIPRHDLGPDGHAQRDLDQRLADAVAFAGGSAVETGWRLPLAVPDLRRDSRKLLVEWNRYTEGRLQQVFVGSMVARLRTWRPSVVVIDQPPQGDAATELLNAAVLHAVEQAGDATRFVEHAELAGLKPWRVKRVFARLAPGSTGHANVDPNELLPYLGQSTRVAAAGAYARLRPLEVRGPDRIAYRLILDQTDAPNSATASGDFFRGIPLFPGTDARRKLIEPDDRQLARQTQIARKQATFRGYTSRFLDDPVRSAQLIGEIRSVVDGMPREQAALMLVELAREYRELSQWDNVEATLAELVERYPTEPAAIDAMFWLFRFWSSTETAWQRNRRVQTQAIRLSSNQGELKSKIAQAIALKRADAPVPESLSPAFGTAKQTAEVTLYGQGQREWRSGSVRDWHKRAAHMVDLIKRNAPRLYESPKMEIPLANLYRRKGATRLAGDIYHRFNAAATEDLWKQTAVTELWAARASGEPPRPVIPCRFTTRRPTLDGLLSEACWQGAVATPLTASGPNLGNKPDHPLVMLAYDDDHLYVAGRFPKTPEINYAPLKTGGRSHDADLASFDRLSLFFDVDRDYATFYAFHVDQRGCTAESCWEDASWNPKWFVFSDLDESHWRFELAIPLNELVPERPTRGTFWAAGVTRIIPTVGVEGWTHPAGSKSRPEAFGLIRFD